MPRAYLAYPRRGLTCGASITFGVLQRELEPVLEYQVFSLLNVHACFLSPISAFSQAQLREASYASLG